MSADIREGDYIRATRKTDPKQTVVGRVGDVDNGLIALKPFLSLVPDNWDFEVLDRPLPPISEELLKGATDAYTRSYNNYGTRAESVAAVINYLREHDTYNKEITK